jgi:hypothetical protein
MVYDIDIHQLNLGQFLEIKVFGWHFIQIFVFLHLFNNECTIISVFKEKNTTISKKNRFYRWALHYFFQFSIVWWCFMNHKHKALSLLKNYKLYTLCTLIYPILFI